MIDSNQTPKTTGPNHRVFLTVKQFSDQQPGLTQGGIRWDLYNRTTNGLAKSGAVMNRGRRILIDPDKYLSWMEDRSAEAGA